MHKPDPTGPNRLPTGHSEYPADLAQLLVDDIIETDMGIFEVGQAHFTAFAAARRYVVNKAVLDEHLRRLLSIEAEAERVLAARETMRARVYDLLESVSREQSDAEGGRDEHELALSFLAVEQRKHRRSIEQTLDVAHSRATSYPETLHAWADSGIHSGHVRVIEQAGEFLDPDYRPQYETEVLAAAPGKTPAQLRRIAKRIVQRLQSAPEADRAVAAAEDRAVWLESQPDGMAHLTIKTTAVLAEAAYDRLRRAAKDAPAEDPGRLSQHMSDTAVAALTSGTCDAGLLDGVTANVTITMPASLLATGEAVDSVHAELLSGTLVDDRTAVRLAGGAASWTRLFTHPVTGVAVTADNYVPTASLRRLILARDMTCRFPGCSQPAHRCDLDHTLDWQHGGRTVPGNLAALCRHHHTLKHRLGPDDGWRVEQTRPGFLEWTAPDGRRHRVEPEPVPTAIPPPASQHQQRHARDTDPPF